MILVIFVEFNFLLLKNNNFNLKTGLRRAGRFDQEIAIGIPDEKQRKRFTRKIIFNHFEIEKFFLIRILEILCRKIKQHANIDMQSIVMNTPGYVGADLNALIGEESFNSPSHIVNSVSFFF